MSPEKVDDDLGIMDFDALTLLTKSQNSRTGYQVPAPKFADRLSGTCRIPSGVEQPIRKQNRSVLGSRPAKVAIEADRTRNCCVSICST
jgi:hypothetical protein